MADWNWNNVGDEDDEDEEQDPHATWKGASPDGLIFLIDCTKPMIEKEGDESCFDLCIKCAKTVIQNKIISSDKDLLGIVFFGTEKSNPEEYKHIYVYHELSNPGAEQVLQLEALLEEEGNNDFATKFGHNEGFSLSDGLWMCSNMFANSPQKLGYKRVMLFTCNDNPHPDDAQLKRQAIAKAEDLSQNSIGVELMHMNRTGHTFDVNAFYKEMLLPDEDEQVTLPDAADRFEELLTRVRSKDHKKRAMTRIPLQIGADFKISVGVYNLVRSCRKPSSVKLYKKTNEEVKAMTKTFLSDTGEILNPKMDMKKAQTYANKLISFEPEEVTQIKTFDDPGLKLMGFKCISSIKKYYHIKPAQFLYPDEKTVEGSTTFFTALLKKSSERNMVPICRYIPRRGIPPRFVALIPQEEELDDNKVQICPPGFHLVFLPYADDIRNVEFEENLPRASHQQIDKAKEILKKLQFSFQSESFENPSLQNHYCALEALALDREEAEKVNDYTVPETERIDKRAGTLMDEFKSMVFPDDYSPGKKSKTSSAASTPAKKAKMEDGVEIDLESELKAGKLSKLTVAILREQTKKCGIAVQGSKKADFIAAIEKHYN